MGVLARLLDLSKAAVNEALDKLEQPGMMLNQYLRDMQEETERLQHAVNRQAAEGRRLEREIAWYESLAEESERKAAGAVADGREAEARQALELKLNYEEKVSESRQAYEASVRQAAEFAERLEQAKLEYAKLQAKRDDLARRAQKLQEQPGKVGEYLSHQPATGSAARGFRRIEETILQREMAFEQERAEKAAAEAARNALIEEKLEKLRKETV